MCCVSPQKPPISVFAVKQRSLSALGPKLETREARDARENKTQGYRTRNKRISHMADTVRTSMFSHGQGSGGLGVPGNSGSAMNLYS